MGICQSYKKYRLLEKCSLESMADDPEGFCLLHSRQAQKDKKGVFTEAVKVKLDEEDFDFRGVYFPGPSKRLFISRKFNKNADFKRVTFQSSAGFWLANFIRGASFSWATFDGGADFSEASFEELVSFHRATFKRKAYFSWAKFKGPVHFTEATFSDDVYFYGAIFLKKISFHGATFQGKAYFGGLRLEEKGERSLEVFSADFQGLNLGPEASLIFTDVPLSRVEFSGTDMRKAEFHNVTWARRHGRNVVYDEILLHESEKRPIRERYARVEELYRLLKLNYEKAGDLKNAGDFHFGEMEMHRQANPLQLWYQFYWALSGYGERPLRSLLVLLGFFLTFAGLFFWLEPNMSGGQSWEGFGSSLLYVFQQGTLQRPSLPENVTYYSKVLASLIPVLIPGQVALFFLALRNRLGRRR